MYKYDDLQAENESLKSQLVEAQAEARDEKSAAGNERLRNRWTSGKTHGLRAGIGKDSGAFRFQLVVGIHPLAGSADGIKLGAR